MTTASSAPMADTAYAIAAAIVLDKVRAQRDDAWQAVRTHAHVMERNCYLERRLRRFVFRHWIRYRVIRYRPLMGWRIGRGV